MSTRTLSNCFRSQNGSIIESHFRQMQKQADRQKQGKTPDNRRRHSTIQRVFSRQIPGID